MIFRVVISFAIVAVGLCAVDKLDLPAAVPICKRDSPRYNICLKHAIQDALPLFVKGLPAEYEFPSMDPLFYGDDEGEFDRGEIQGKIFFKNVTLAGFGAARVKAVKSHFDNDTFHLEIDFYIPAFYIETECDAHGTIGGFSMGGTGHYSEVMEDIRALCDMLGVVKDDTLIIEHFRLTPEIRTLKIRLDNFFEGNREFNNLLTQFLNDNWPPLLRIALPFAIDHFDKFATNSLNRLFSKLSFSKVFP